MSRYPSHKIPPPKLFPTSFITTTKSPANRTITITIIMTRSRYRYRYYCYCSCSLSARAQHFPNVLRKHPHNPLLLIQPALPHHILHLPSAPSELAQRYDLLYFF